MRGLPALIRLHRWQLDGKRRELADLERLEDQLLGEMRKLEDWVAAEQAFARDSESGGFAWTGFARGVKERRARIQASIDNIHRQVEAKREEVADAFRELKRYEITQAEREKREKLEADRRAQTALDEVSLIQYERRD
jgi:flagellar export protein FliJ